MTATVKSASGSRIEVLGRGKILVNYKDKKKKKTKRGKKGIWRRRKEGRLETGVITLLMGEIDKN